MPIEVVRTYWSWKENPNGEKVSTVRQLCIWNGKSGQRRFTRKVFWNELKLNVMENTIINQESDGGLAEAWNRARYDLYFGDIEDWYSDGVTGVEIEICALHWRLSSVIRHG